MINENQSKFYYKDGSLHREDGPAREFANGIKEWIKEWWIGGLLHRIDGPAIEYADGTKQWWIDGKNYNSTTLIRLREENLFLGKEKGKYDLYWLKFLTENQGVQEFPVIPGMDTCEKLSFVLKGFAK